MAQELLSAEAAVLHAAIEGDYDQVRALLLNKQIWSRNGVWRFHRKLEELDSFCHNLVAEEMDDE